MTESLKLKWGTLKGWEIESEANLATMEKYLNAGAAMGAMQQQDTPEQKQLICDLIDGIDGEIWNDWDGVVMTKEAAKNYVNNYGKPKAA